MPNIPYRAGHPTTTRGGPSVTSGRPRLAALDVGGDPVTRQRDLQAAAQRRRYYTTTSLPNVSKVRSCRLMNDGVEYTAGVAGLAWIIVLIADEEGFLRAGDYPRW